MKILISTVGGAVEPILIAARKVGFDKVILIAGKSAEDVFGNKAIEGKPNPIEVAKEIRKRLKDFGAEVKIKVVNPFDFEECCIETLKVLESERKYGEIFVSITGGTKILSLASSCAAFISGCKIIYVQELKDGAKLTEIPYNLSQLDELSKAKKDVIKIIVDGDTSLDIAEKLKISRKTASQYLKELKEYGLLEVFDGKLKKYKLTFLGKLCKARWGVFG